MDRPDRTNGMQRPQDWSMPLKGQPERINANKNPSKGMSEGRRPSHPSGPNGVSVSVTSLPPPPVPTLRKVASNSNLSTATTIVPTTATIPTTTPTPPAQVIQLAREALRQALESESRAVEASAVGSTGVTIDLGRQNIQKLPEEVVDIIKNQVGRLAMSHNLLSSLPARFSECKSLRYLNVRGNQIREFPQQIYDLHALEILDLGRNQLRVLPSDIARLSSLKVLSIHKNQIRELPTCLGDMGSLQVFKFDQNPISFPPRDAIQIPAGSPPTDLDNSDVAITAHVKKVLRQYSQNERMDSEPFAEESSDTPETPRVPLKRTATGRFPIRVNATDVSDSRTSSFSSRPPPIANGNRSHSRGLSQQNSVARRPGVLPLTMGGNERFRSNSETLLRSDRAESRNRRMGIVSKKPDLGTLDETQAFNRFSHGRGLSHGSAMLGAPVGSNSPLTPTDPDSNRPIFVRRLSVLPERRRESRIADPIIEAAKGILYAVFQTHYMIEMLMSLTSDGSAKRSSLEIVFYNTNSHVVELEQAIVKYDTAILEDDNLSYDNEAVHRACQTLVLAYGHMCALVVDNIDTFVDNGDPRYIRTLLTLLFNSIMEIRATLTAADRGAQPPASARPEPDMMNGGNTIRPHYRDTSLASFSDRSASRSRNGVVVHNPSNLRVATHVNMPPHHGPARTAVMALATPRSDESLALSTSSRAMNAEFSEEDALFERVYLSLQRSTDTVLQTLPNFYMQLCGDVQDAMHKRAPNNMVQDWRQLIAMCGTTIQKTETLKGRLSTLKLKEPGVRSQPGFWSLCSYFVLSWTELASQIKYSINKLPLPADTRYRLKPIQQSMKETSNVMMHSPWHHHLRSSSLNGGAGPLGGPGSAQLPITPQSAALGPAMQATMPITPQGPSFASAFHGNVFERADALMANPGKSMTRVGTMVRGHSGLNSLSSISSMSSDGTSSTSFSSMGNGAPGPHRYNGSKGF